MPSIDIMKRMTCAGLVILVQGGWRAAEAQEELDSRECSFGPDGCPCASCEAEA